MCRSPFALFIVYFRIQKSNQSKRIHRWPFRPTSVIVLCFHFIFAGCLLVFEQYLVKWECSLSATAVQEILISARYPAEISFLILFCWKYSFYFFYKVFCSCSIWNAAGCLSPPMMVYDQTDGNCWLVALLAAGAGAVQLFLHLSKVSLWTQSSESPVLILLNRY